MSKPIVIFGVGDYARIARRYLEDDGNRTVVAFSAHARYLDTETIDDKPTVAYEELAERFPPDEAEVLVAIGFSGVNKARREIYEEVRERGYECPTYISSKARVWDPENVGPNTFIFEDNVVQPNVTVGADCVIWSGNHIGHDSTIEDHCFIASHAVISGNCRIGEGSFVGVNATFRDGVTVASQCVIGAGALILHDTEHGAVHAVRGTEALAKKSWELRSF